MARFPDHVVFADSGINAFEPGSTEPFQPGIIISALVTVHDNAQDGGVENRNVGSGDVWFRTNTPFDVLFDVTIATRDYFSIRSYFRGIRERSTTTWTTGFASLPRPTSQSAPAIYADGYVPRGVFRYPDRQNVIVLPVPLPGYADPFGTPLDPQRGEQGLAIMWQMVRKEETRFTVKREVLAF